jgi:hypothetical protein
MNNPLVSETELRQVISSVVNNAIEGDMKAAAIIFNHFVPKLKPVSRSTPYKSIEDIRNAYFLGIVSSEEVITSLTALNLLKDESVVGEVAAWTPEMLNYIAKINSQ